ncbi:alpha/beta hydrolase [Haliangium ochraceum]|uniref:Esterase of the alpha/beta hydrolase fold-like protein n=1 Tax=Haliangium ochraceum (strain DSM 14365 / JCM 11303 / SMP-2) TaxID=502025 RepID=D0LLH6_HALO1|nr:alpha/beta hydrolase [Haliangium ochraceum]ACY13193.1 esterase of the alpha/beta hydrolase fold-like protein [Haliangium ochraceum DSM 14365]
MTRLCIVPRWAGTQDHDFYPWLRADEQVRARFEEFVGPEVEHPEAPTIDAWLGSLAHALPPEQLGDTYVLAHSVGCQAVLHHLARVRREAGDRAESVARVPGLLCVAGWWDVDEPWGTLRPWIDQQPDTELVRAALEKIIVLLSDNDPFTSDWRDNERQWRERLGAEVRVVPGAKHFNGAQEPAVRDALLALLG